MTGFFISDYEDIKQGRTTDIYFMRTKEILKSRGKDRVHASAEVTCGNVPDGRDWGVLCGIEEVARLLEGLPIDVYAMPEGSLFSPSDCRGVRLPVIVIEGSYYEFCEYETPLLGFICQESGVASRAAYAKMAAGEKTVVAFGIRRQHPGIAPAMDRAAYIGGMDGVSSLIGAETIQQKAMGTMPHSLIIVFEDQVEAWKAYNEVMPDDVPRVCLVDTYYDEKKESVMAAEALGEELDAIRLDTPGTRRGDFAKIIKEVRWELDLRGYNDVEIFVSGGLNENSIHEMAEAGADAFGVGTWVSGAPTVDFALDITELEGRPAAKRGKLSGRKQVWRCRECILDLVRMVDSEPPKCPLCGGETEAMLKPLIRNGEIVAELPEPRKIREYTMEQVRRITDRASEED
ncbi:MAG: nicotinate phosphoribosyltransferase [Candidatus Bathyarchaeia archaeon]